MTSLSRHFIFIGVPGAGKGTFSKIFCNKLGWQHVSLGDVMREEVKKKSMIGKEVEGYMSSGKLVPDKLAVNLALDTINNIVSKSPKSTIILDGFPRTVQQAESIADKYPNFFAINLMLKRSVAIEKLAGRVTCSKCKKDWNVSNIIYDGYRMPSLLPTKEKCPNKLSGRYTIINITFIITIIIT
jgi:adenylate kinase